MKKNTKDIAKRYAAEAKASGRSMETCIRKFLEHQASIDANFAKAYMPEKFNDCIKFVCDCAREILSSKSGEVADEVCYKMAMDFYNERIWEDEEKPSVNAAESAESSEASNEQAEEKTFAEKLQERVEKSVKPAPMQLDLFGGLV